MSSDSGSPDPRVVQVSSDLEPLIPRFLERRREEADALKAAAAAEDLEALRSIGHALKGTAGGYGFHGLTDLGADLETAAREGDLAACVTTVEAIVEYVATVRVEYV